MYYNWSLSTSYPDPALALEEKSLLYPAALLEEKHAGLGDEVASSFNTV